MVDEDCLEACCLLCIGPDCGGPRVCIRLVRWCDIVTCSTVTRRDRPTGDASESESLWLQSFPPFRSLRNLLSSLILAWTCFRALHMIL